MCGIAGTLGFNEDRVAVDRAALLCALQRRGPDDEGAWHDGPLSLVHRRLSVLDLTDAGQQPMLDGSGRFAMVFNGEIYNHRELRAQYLPGYSFKGSSDSETLLELYARDGVDCLSRLNGIFALAIWDRRERSLVLVRDGVGVKPLYCWRRAEGGLAFASELKALRELDGFTSALDPVAAAAYLTYLYSPGERTMFADVRKHPAGVWRRFDAVGRAKGEGRFYSLPAYEPRAMSADEAVSGTYRELGAAVDRQMLADVEIGAFLSGGLDSTSIVHFARRQVERPLRCFTIRYDADVRAAGEMVADLPFARTAAKHLGVDLHEVAVDPGLVRDLPLLVDMLDEPQADPAALANYFISSAARDLGIKVLLGGAGGDDVFTGYRRHSIAAHDEGVGTVPGGLRRLALSVASAIPSNSEALRRMRKALSAIQGSREERLLRAFEWLPADRAANLLEADVDPGAVIAPFSHALARTEGNPIERMLRLEQEFFLRDHNLNYTDKTGMAASVEIRVPFLDPVLMEFAAAMPTEFKLRGGKTKWALRKAMEPHLPHDVIYRPKTGFGVPLRSWLLGPMRDTIGDLTASELVAARGLFDPAKVTALRDDHFAGRIDAAYPLLGLVLIELWCRRFA
ncbi:asparagine synthase (glutamine-hydrolyzing) [Tsuneonella sp. YG55]|uniref:asparagine synthase (glutamine-hydrolyzing) n=1 Tax=Tsuneonella litorea TaxID=2976475 RepID=A0A9X2VYP3_9SPHN|nr:asparagine synthase (glutamine-hydrolyzing) [Tsuneonella litorea]MCT2557780.1 asparagine synthase (glutamine-hydrolyzing) [Tsuneonella litorea]